MAEQANNNRSSNAKFYSVSEFKKMVSGSSTTPIQFLQRTNKDTGLVTKFASINGKAFKMQGDLDPAKEIRFLVVDDNFNEGCLVNVKQSSNIETLFTI